MSPQGVFNKNAEFEYRELFFFSNMPCQIPRINSDSLNSSYAEVYYRFEYQGPRWSCLTKKEIHNLELQSL